MIDWQQYRGEVALTPLRFHAQRNIAQPGNPTEPFPIAETEGTGFLAGYVMDSPIALGGSKVHRLEMPSHSGRHLCHTLSRTGEILHDDAGPFPFPRLKGACDTRS